MPIVSKMTLYIEAEKWLERRICWLSVRNSFRKIIRHVVLLGSNIMSFRIWSP